MANTPWDRRRRAPRVNNSSDFVDRETRERIYARDGYRCRYCKRGPGDGAMAVRLTLDHLRPAALGGSDEEGNLVTACLSCNGARGDSSVLQRAGWRITAERSKARAAEVETTEDGKVYNHPEAMAEKVDLRLRVLEAVRPARVMEACCGPVGEMYRRAWHMADGYAGIDTAFELSDVRRRYVGDNRVVLRGIPLGGFNVFDLDSFTSPWALAVIIAARRPWAPGERGALVVTDCTGAFSQRGARPCRGLYELSGLQGILPRKATGHDLREAALRGWVERARVRVLHRWEFVRKGSADVVYLAIVFEGLGAA